MNDLLSHYIIILKKEYYANDNINKINDNIELKYYANLVLKIQNIPDDCR